MFKENERMRFVELKLPNYGAFHDLFLKIPDEGRPGGVWHSYSEKAKRFALDGVAMGGWSY